MVDLVPQIRHTFYSLFHRKVVEVMTINETRFFLDFISKAKRPTPAGSDASQSGRQAFTYLMRGRFQRRENLFNSLNNFA
ncbi:MAG: hypothetical protein NPIRA06_00040 [Nitrospirales bacterium]|nr:MAG: hypothetical protein NPIRA06_00040 [Nitrospirales bacterium]